MRWSLVSGWPLYEVSEGGEVRNVKTGRILRQRLNPGGYPLVDLNSGARYGMGGRRRATFTVHRLVCEAFHGPKPSPRHEVAHNNGIRTDCRKENLRWATRAENHADKEGHGTTNRGDRNGAGCKLSKEDVRAIRADSRPHAAIAKDYPVHMGTVGKIKRGEKWAWLA